MHDDVIEHGSRYLPMMDDHRAHGTRRAYDKGSEGGSECWGMTSLDISLMLASRIGSRERHTVKKVF